MPKITVADLKKIKEAYSAGMRLREGTYRAKITVYLGTCGIAAGARKIVTAFLKEMENRKTSDVLLLTSGCAGHCAQEPMAAVELFGQAPVTYGTLTEEKARAIFDQHVIGGAIVEQYVLAAGAERSV